eukprot:GDKI01021482.1.p1 GENE.GDKI01021482.1~~GDKI01021482.1.p1  ORF type:complete len:326 (-),score=68.70 GDKI01021482.1:24-962(-)
MGVATKVNEKTGVSGTEGPKSFTRNKTDYFVMALFFAILIALGQIFTPGLSKLEDIPHFKQAYDPLNLENTLPHPYGTLFSMVLYAVQVATALYLLTFGCWAAFRAINASKAPYNEHFYVQRNKILINFGILACVSAGQDYLMANGYTKATMGNSSPLEILRDCCLWMLCFELCWYTQHRAMHEVKLLWHYGHSYHHQWRRPQHMLGITNFAFDHVIEVWVTMSSSFFGYVFFPSNFYAGKMVALVYMVFAILAHWDGWGSEKTGWGRYHINHHYLVTKNYGSHIPIFDIIFGTYQWDPYVHPDNKVDAKAE